ncbi:acylneuraminate cytidylyltransferase family protein [Desulfobacula toluolica]|uniref:NeuA: N-acetylneuraminate cytidylyltransferase n=1 Tax=Desulfobacula toluolica (strain DSM 7467 / Tol2) TaxID=651182 RepID=K0NNS1_DESTT|nr:acylneuraminate cytidylyltransferase family protein [Desulfobacula toluolica]CCK81698.1 NeuA: N-acetylneuraminate cytidylyltransferase [Desulfobacula toluolica Tol2]
MKDNKKILAIIPARGGSKGVLKKNIKLLAGKPLIAWTIETALSVTCLDRVILSTDDRQISEIGKQYGAEVPFLRPEKIAADDTLDMPVYEHALAWLNDNENFCPDIIVWLRPTAPLRIAQDINNALDILIKKEPDWVRSVCEVEHHPYWMYKLNEGSMEPFIEGIQIKNYMRRQLLPPAYRLNGAVEVAWRSTILEKKLLYSGEIEAYIMPSDRSIDIDSEMDFRLAQTYMKLKKNE